MNWDLNDQHLVNAYLNKLSSIYENATKKAVGLGYSLSNAKSDIPFEFASYPGGAKQSEKLFTGVAYEIQTLIDDGTETAWLQANKNVDTIVDNYFKNSGIPKTEIAKYYDRNLEALKAFQQRVDDGGTMLSDRVWKYTNQFKSEIEMAISVGIGEGKSAAELSRDIRQYLQQPDKLFHKVKDKFGNLKLSKHAAAYHPGQGVYRSSYKNAMRVTRTEINMAYHQADNARWNTLDFVTGYQVSLSNAHPETDICDELQGIYPKTFHFWGWHVQCMCHTTPIMTPQDDFVSNMADILKGKTPGKAPQMIEEMPDNFKAWAHDNEAKIQKANSLPYFIEKNFAGTNVSDWWQKAEKTPQIVEKTTVFGKKALTPEQKKAYIQESLNFANKKLKEAEKLGITGANYDATVAAVNHGGLTYSQIDKVSDKLSKEIKLFKLNGGDPYSEQNLLQKYSKEQVDSLFTAYNNFKNKIAGLDTETQIKKLNFEVGYVLDKNQFETSTVMAKMLKRDLDALLATQQKNKVISAANDFVNGYLSISDKAVKAEVAKLQKELIKTDVDIAALQAKIDNANSVVEKYYEKLSKQLGEFPMLPQSEIDRLLADYFENTISGRDAGLRERTVDFWNRLSLDERNAITKYTQTYSYLNEPLRDIPYYGTTKPNTEHLNDLPLITESLNRCLTTENMVVRRGVNSWKVRELGYGLDELKAGDEFVDKGFSSTSVHRDGGFHKDYDLIIVVPKGAAGIYAEPFSHYTDSGKFLYANEPGNATLWNGMSKEELGRELEWIGQRGAKYRVIKKQGSRIYLQLIGQLK